MRRLLALALFCLASLVLVADERIDAFRRFAEEQMKAQKMTGLSVAVVHGDDRWSGAFGYADVENEVAARADSSYRMASVTKPMTAVAVLKLADEGKVDLDAEVQTYVPYFPRKAKPVTVRQLLEHQGGISHYKDYMKEGRIREPKTTREAIAIFQDWDLIADPGTAFHYSTYGFNLLGAVIEGASGKPYGEYMTENVWKPLGMTSTRMDDPRALIPHRVTGYTLVDGKVQRSEYVDISSRFGGGGTRSTVEDMLRFIEGLAAGKVLKASTRDAAWTKAPTSDGRYTRYGMGFGVYERNGRWVVAHSGSQQETRTELMIIPSAHFAVALASNFEDADLDPFEDKLVSLFLGEPAEIDARTNDDASMNVWRAMNAAYDSGLAYYDRYGRAMTADARELQKALAYFRNATTDAKLAEDGNDPVSGEELTKFGSAMAAALAKNGDLEVYHREGALRFFADYAKTKGAMLNGKLVPQIAEWQRQWATVWTPETQAFRYDALERNRAALVAATIKPDYTSALVDYSERRAMDGDVAGATHAMETGLAIYPRSGAVNGLLGVLRVVAGEPAKGKELLATSMQIDPRGYASARNLLQIVEIFVDADMKPAALALAQTVADLHPTDDKVRARLASLTK